MLRLF